MYEIKLIDYYRRTSSDFGCIVGNETILTNVVSRNNSLLEVSKNELSNHLPLVRLPQNIKLIKGANLVEMTTKIGKMSSLVNKNNKHHTSADSISLPITRATQNVQVNGILKMKKCCYNSKLKSRLL